MKAKLKVYGPIIILALIFYTMLSTPHSRGLGDMILETMGRKSWTDGYSGLHLTVIYFGVLFFLVYIIYKLFVKDES